MVGLVPTIQPSASSGACGTLDPRDPRRRVRPPGTIKWRGELVFIGEALAGELLGLAEIESGGHIVRFCGRDLRFLRSLAACAAALRRGNA